MLTNCTSGSCKVARALQLTKYWITLVSLNDSPATCRVSAIRLSLRGDSYNTILQRTYAHYNIYNLQTTYTIYIFSTNANKKLFDFLSFFSPVNLTANYFLWLKRLSVYNSYHSFLFLFRLYCSSASNSYYLVMFNAL